MKRILASLLCALTLAAPASAEFLVNDCATRYRYAATASQTAFSYPCEFEATGDLVVLQDNAGDGVFVTLTETTDYTVSGASTSGGGTVTLTTGATLNDVVVIYRDMDVDRTTDFTSTITAPALNLALDRLTLMVQQLEQKVDDQALKFEVQDVTGSTSPLIDLTGNASKFLQINASATGLTYTTVTPGTTAGDVDGGSWTTVADTVQLRRGTLSTRRAVTPSEGECGWDTTDKKLYCGDGSTAGGVDVSGYPYFDVTAYGATGDGVTDDNTAVQAALTAAIAGDGILLFPAGTYLISDSLDISAVAANGTQILGVGMPTISMSDLTDPIVILGTRNRVENLTLRYATRPGASDLRAVGIQIGPRGSAVESTQSTVRNVQIERTFVGIQSGANQPAGEADTLFGSGFSNTYEGLTIRDFYYSAIVLNRASSGALSGGNNTGDAWTNIYINGRQFDGSTRVNPAGDVIWLRQHINSVFNQLNIEWIGDTSGGLGSPSFAYNLIDFGAGGGEVNNLVVNSLHVEGIYTAQSGGTFFEFVDNASLILNGFDLSASEFATGSGNFYNLARFTGDRSSLMVNGFTLHGNTLTSGTFRYAATNGSRSGNSVRVLGYAPGDDDTAIITNNTAGISAVDNDPVVKQVNDTIYYEDTSGQGLFVPYNRGNRSAQYTLDTNGVLTLVGDEMWVAVDTFSSAATDYMDAISETPTPADGQILILSANNSSRDVTVRSGASIPSGADAINLDGNMPFVFSSTSDRLILQYTAATAQWQELARRSGQAYQRAQLKNTSSLTVSSNTIAPTGSRHLIDNSGGTATVSTITPPLGGAYDDGMILYLSTSTTGNAVTIADYVSGANNIYAGTDCVLDTDEDVWVGFWRNGSSGWLEIACQDNN